MLLLSCSSNPFATAKYKSNFNFSTIESYSTYARNSAFGEFQNISDTTRNSIEIAIEKVLDRRGFHYKNNENSDVIIGYHLIGKLDDLKKYNRGVRYCDPCLHAGLAVKNKKAWKMIPGSLILDVVHQKNKRSIWRSVYPLMIKPKDNSRQVQKKIQQAIANMMKTLPQSLS
ncbi:DUF4136 domain-containing protein [Colwelliaceae bacterium 6441]